MQLSPASFPFYLFFLCVSILLPWKSAAYANSQTELHLICISQLLLSSLSTAKKFYYVDTYTYLEDSGVNILWENPDSWDQKLEGEHFPLSLFMSWVKAFEVCSI